MPKRISEEEFRQRWGNIRNLMRQEDLSALLIFSQRRGHVTYLSGYHPNYHTNCAVMVLPLAGDPILWIKFPFDLPRARAMSWVQDIRGSASEETGRMMAECTNEIRSLGLERSRIGLVAKDLAIDEMSVSLHEHIRSQLPKAQLENASDLLNQLRLIKSQKEIDNLREATQVAEGVAESLRQAIKPGVKDSTATLAAEHAGRLAGAEECTVLISTDSSHMALPSSSFEFHSGGVVNCEITVRLHGYWVQICRVFSLAKPSSEQRKIFAVCHQAYDAAVAAARPANTVARMAKAAYKAIAEGGYKDYISYGAGHGVGLDLPELYPLDVECKAALTPNMIFIVHPAIWVPGRGAAWVGGPIVTSEDGPVRLDQPQGEIIEV